MWRGASLLGRAALRLVGWPLPLSRAALVAPAAPAAATVVTALIPPAAAPLALVAPAAAAAAAAAATAAAAAAPAAASLLVPLPQVGVDRALHEHGDARQPVAKVVLVRVRVRG